MRGSPFTAGSPKGAFLQLSSCPSCGPSEMGAAGQGNAHLSPPAWTTCCVPDILDSRFPISFFPPNFQAVHQQDDKLSILHADGHHLPVRAVGRTPGCMAQVHLVEQLLC